MATGMEMMVAAVLKASGLDMEKVKEDIVQYGKNLAEKIASMDAALTTLRDEQTRLVAAVEAIRTGQIVLSDLLYEIARHTHGTNVAAFDPPTKNGETNGTDTAQ